MIYCSIWWHQDRKRRKGFRTRAVHGVRHGMWVQKLGVSAQCLRTKGLSRVDQDIPTLRESRRLGRLGLGVQECCVSRLMARSTVPGQPKIKLIKSERIINLAEYVSFL